MRLIEGQQGGSDAHGGGVGNRGLARRHPVVALAERQPSASPPAIKAGVAFEAMHGQVDANEFVLEPVAPDEVAAIRRKNAAAVSKPLQVGVVRSLDSIGPGSGWIPAGDGWIRQWAIRAIGAQALRVKLDVRSTAPGVRARFAPAAQHGAAIGERAEVTGELWGPVISGEQAVVEVFVPAYLSPSRVDIAPTQLADHFANPLRPDVLSTAKWNAQPCQPDLICESRGNPALARAGSASLKISWVYGAGAYACSATLLNPADGSFRPYVYTAAHCINDQGAASNVVSHWFYDMASCGGDAVRSDAVQVGGGAQHLALDDMLDASLLKLNRMPPAGVTYAGWDSDAPSPGEDVTAIHHANAEVTKVSHATVLPPPPYAMTAVAWTSGIAQGGSSGSGLFTRVSTANDHDYLFRGALSGTTASCAAPGTAVYSRLDAFWPKAAPYLSKQAASTNATGLWSNAAEPGWGVSLNQQGDTVFGLLFLAGDDGRPTWLVASDMRKEPGNTYSGALYRTTGSALHSDAKARTATQVGSMRIWLASADEAEVSWTNDGATQVKRITKLAYAGAAPVCTTIAAKSRASATNYQDLWSNPAEPGWGIAIAHQQDVLFATVFSYDEAGASTWYVASDVQRTATGGYGGALYEMIGGKPVSVGDIRLAFQDGQRAMATLSIRDHGVMKPITRQVFAESAPICR